MTTAPPPGIQRIPSSHAEQIAKISVRRGGEVTGVDQYSWKAPGFPKKKDLTPENMTVSERKRGQEKKKPFHGVGAHEVKKKKRKLLALKTRRIADPYVGNKKAPKKGQLCPSGKLKTKKKGVVCHRRGGTRFLGKKQERPAVGVNFLDGSNGEDT